MKGAIEAHASEICCKETVSQYIKVFLKLLEEEGLVPLCGCFLVCGVRLCGAVRSVHVCDLPVPGMHVPGMNVLDMHVPGIHNVQHVCVRCDFL